MAKEDSVSKRCFVTVILAVVLGMIASFSAALVWLEGHHQSEIDLLMNKLSKEMHEGKMTFQPSHHLIRREANSDDPSQQEAEELLKELSLAQLMGLQGPPGRDGKDGADGRDGRDGRDGKDGVGYSTDFDNILGQILKKLQLHINDSTTQESTSALSSEEQLGLISAVNGTIGKALLQAIARSNARLGILESQIDIMSEQDDHINHPEINANAGGKTTYIRWGRKTCGNNSTVIYEGFAGGQWYDQTGGASERVCLPLEPEWSTYNVNVDTGNSIYGSEYKTGSFGIFPDSLFQQNVPCAACLAVGRTNTLMIPAKRNCPAGWNKEYEGYLMAERRGHKASAAYSCVDADPEYIEGMHANKNGALFYFVQAHCDTTGHCPPYINDAELTCVVCTY